jgi:hypothetical protein
MLAAANEDGERMVEANWPTIRLVAHELVRRRHLDADEVHGLIDGRVTHVSEQTGKIGMTSVASDPD